MDIPSHIQRNREKWVCVYLTKIWSMHTRTHTHTHVLFGEMVNFSISNHEVEWKLSNVFISGHTQHIGYSVVSRARFSHYSIRYPLHTYGVWSTYFIRQTHYVHPWNCSDTVLFIQSMCLCMLSLPKRDTHSFEWGNVHATKST